MAIYQFECPDHGIFETILKDVVSNSSCPQCGHCSPRVFSVTAIIRVHHTEKLDYNDPLRVDDRHRMMKDTAVKKALKEYTEEQRELPESPYKEGVKHG